MLTAKETSGKTCNLTDVHVTIGIFKHLAVLDIDLTLNICMDSNVDLRANYLQTVLPNESLLHLYSTQLN